MSESGEGCVDVVNAELRRALTLTSADLRFADFVMREAENNEKSPSGFSFISQKLFLNNI